MSNSSSGHDPKTSTRWKSLMNSDLRSFHSSIRAKNAKQTRAYTTLERLYSSRQRSTSVQCWNLNTLMRKINCSRESTTRSETSYMKLGKTKSGPLSSAWNARDVSSTVNRSKLEGLTASKTTLTAPATSTKWSLSYKKTKKCSGLDSVSIQRLTLKRSGLCSQTKSQRCRLLSFQQFLCGSLHSKMNDIATNT